MKIGIYGGTFNPPHLGHMAAAKTAAQVLGLDKLILIPAAEPPHKQLPEGSASPEQRLEMVRLMADNLNMPGVVQVSDVELRRQGKSYTSDTLTVIKAFYPEAELWLLMGTDMFLTLQNWHKPERIMELAGICAFGRTEQDGEELFAPQRKFLQEKYNARLTTITLPGLVDISSTQLREVLDDGQGEEYLCPAVYGYILMNGLYGTKADLKHLDLPELRACSYSMVRAKRIPHIRGTEEEAVRLAKRWDVDETLVRRAAILHDCTKYLELDEQLALCKKYGVELDELEQRAVKLLHSKTGACIAKHVFGEDEQVYQAIFWHTTGKVGMSMAEKVIYLADYIEPTRDFDGVEPLRKLAYEDIDKALLMGMEMTIEEMKQRGNPIHRNTQAARDWLCSHAN
ncbi:MAG: nicotinate (nicotinamide) nucleotide adenylyltransferase [Oscillospiraceae bacterium]|nr:nicotinate (nicotinamide) nucleotide adenylyltransferase [Oscillospiraceae bacterium]